MNRLLIALPLAFVWFANSLFATHELSSEEIKRAADYLEKTRAAVLAATDGLSEAQWNFKPGPTRWSVAEVAEHIAAAEDMLMGMIEKDVIQAPARTEAVDVKEVDNWVLTVIPDRSQKLQAPEPLIPTMRFGSTDNTLEHFKESRAKTLAFLKETKELRDHAIDSPFGKKLDAYQWLLFISAHCERHLKQINEVKADPAFPKK